MLVIDRKQIINQHSHEIILKANQQQKVYDQFSNIRIYKQTQLTVSQIIQSPRSNMEPQRQPSLLNQLRQEWTCPITHHPIRQPVITTAGNTYEKEALNVWLRENDTDPKSREEITQKKPIPNIALQNVKQILERELPKIEFQLEESQNTIIGLREEIESLRHQLTQEREQNQAYENLVHHTIHETNKIKKIQKGMNDTKESEKAKLREKIAENRRLRQTFVELRIKEKQIDELRKQERENGIQIIGLTQEKGLIDYDLNNTKNWCRALKKGLEETVARANEMFQHEHYYREMIIKCTQKIFANLGQQGQDQQLVEGNIIQTIKKNIIDEIQESRLKDLELAVGDEHHIDDMNQFYDKAVNYARIEKMFGKKIQGPLIELTAFLDQTHQEAFVNQQLGLIPFSDPPTEEELKVTWENVIEIRTSDLYEVSQSQWNTLISNIGKFPRLCNLLIMNCRFTTITVDDLEKLSKLHKVSFIERTFSEETRRLLDGFKENHDWIQVTHNRI